MKSVLTYSGITTKTRALSAKLLSDDDYAHLRSCTSVSEALSFLEQFKSYNTLFRDLQEVDARRGVIEPLLMQSLYQDFSRIYRFANGDQRAFLNIYFRHYEIAILKRCLRSAYAGSAISINLDAFRSFFDSHSDYDLARLSGCRSMDELLPALKGSIYYDTLYRMQQSNRQSLFDYENALDLFYFKYIWKKKGKLLSKADAETIQNTFGNKIDLLNMQWILRAKKNYHMSNADIYAMIIPVYYKLHPQDIQALVETASYEDSLRTAAGTWYGSRFGNEFKDVPSLELLYIQLIEKINALAARNHPYSVAVINSYLYKKEHEIDRITTILESIRYGLAAKETSQYVKKNQEVRTR